MRENPIRLQQIQLRQQHVKTSNVDFAAMVEAEIKNAKTKEKKLELIEQFFSICKSTDSVEKSFPMLIDYLNECNNERATKAMLSQFRMSIAPVVENTNMALKEIERINDDDIRESCLNAVSDCVAIDTLLNNHDRMSKRFDVNGYVTNHQFYNMEEVCAKQFCEWIDTYQIAAKDKCAIALEETLYAFAKGSLIHDRSNVVQAVMEYFLVSNSIDNNTAKEILEKCQFIDEDDTKNVRYIFGESTSDEVRDVINQCKTDDKFNDSIFKRAMNSIYSKSPEQIIDNTPNILSWLRQLAVLSTLGINLIVGAVAITADKFIQMGISRKQVERVERNFNSEKEKTQKAISKAEGEERDRLQEYSDSLDKAMTRIDEYKNTLYTYEELTKQNKIEEESANLVPVTLNEFKKFKFNNIMDIAIAASNYIKTNYDKAAKKLSAKVMGFFKKDEDVDDTGKAKKKAPVSSKALKDGIKSIASHFTESLIDSNVNLFDAVLVTFNVSEATADEIFNFATGICDDVQNRYGLDGKIHFYTNTSDGICEVHMVDSTPVMLTESEKEKYTGYFVDSDLTLLKEFGKLTSLIERYVSYKPDTIMSDLLESDIDFDRAYTIMELQQYSGLNESDEMWDKISNKYSHDEFKNLSIQEIDENTKMNNLEYNFNESGEIPFDIQVEACGLMRDVLNEGIDLSGVRVAIQGMKSKVKNLGVKEKEISRDMDAAANGFMRSVENALTNDRREAIIKGSIIPSFSKCIKTAIAGAGVYAIGGPTAAVIGIIGALAGSRYLNNKERMLLLDEIEVELKVVNKELQKAEQDDDMKRYRQLLTYQKKLKKEDFKLRYNVSRKMGKDYLTKGNNDVGGEDD